MGKGKTVRYWPKNFAWEIATHRSSCQDRGARRGPCGAGAGSSLRSEGDARQKKQGRWHRCGSRRAKLTHPRHALIRHPLKQTNVKVKLVPLNGRALNLDEGKRHRRLPLLGRFQDQIVESIADAIVLTVEGIGKVV